MELDKLRPKLLDAASIEQADLLTLLESATNGLWLWLIEHNELYWSAGLAATLGYPLDGKGDIPHILELTHDEDRERHEQAIARSFESGESYYIEVRLVRSDGTPLWLAASGMWHRHPDGRAHTMLGFVRDISARIEATQQLAASEARFRNFFDQAPAAVYIKDEHSRHLYGNEMAATIAGTDVDTFIGSMTNELFDAESAARLREADLEALQTNDKVTWIGPVRVAGEQTERYVWDTKFPLVGPDGSRLVGGVGIDVTALHETQRQLAIAQRLESMGLMASGVAHDFNNLLFAISGNAETALQYVDREHRSNIQSILAATEHAAGLCRQLLAIGGRVESTVQTLNIAEFLRESVRLLEMTVQVEHTLALEVADAGCHVRVDAGQLRQVLVNLVLNARQASEPGATIRIGCEPAALGMVTEASSSNTHSWLPERSGDGVCIYVEDHGHGIASERLDRIFDPYYTDHELGHGLGLATVLGIVKAARGAIRVDSVPGEGTRFEIYLPQAEVHATSEQRAEAPRKGPSAGLRRIMVIDDHAEIVAIVVAWLERLGVEVTSFTSSLLAVDVLRTRHAEYDAVLTDISMPDIGGIGVLQAVRERDPDKPVILASGYNDSAFQVDDDPGVWFLQKPYSLSELQRVLEEIAAPGK